MTNQPDFRKLLEEATRHFRLPLEGDEGCMKIWDADTHLVADVRSWGYLTGKGSGALGLSEYDAITAQRELMDLIVAAVNALPAHLARIAELEAENAGLREKDFYSSFEIDRLKSALKPFAEAEQSANPAWPDDASIRLQANGCAGSFCHIRTGDFRRARAALSGSAP